MLGIGLLVHVQHLTGSFAAAGVVNGAYGLALGVGGPLLGRLVDRRGQTSVLLAAPSVAAALLVGMAVLPVGTPLVALHRRLRPGWAWRPRRSAPACVRCFPPCSPIPARSAPLTRSRRPRSS